MRWTVEEVAGALVLRRPEALTPWPGWPVSRLILAPWSCELFVAIHGPRHDDTIMSGRPWKLARWPVSCGRPPPDMLSRTVRNCWPFRTLSPRSKTRSGGSNAMGQRLGPLPGRLEKPQRRNLAALLASRFAY